MNAILCSLFTIFLVNEVLSDMQKPGKCLPWNGDGGNCQQGCKSDWDCNGLQKCCGIGCGLMCQEPCHPNCDINCVQGRECKVIDGCAQCVLSTGGGSSSGNSNAPQDKPGKCAPWTGAAVTIKNCENDSGCSGNKKCCSVGGGRLCQDPCKTVCDWKCLSGTDCQVVDGCAQCVPSSGSK